MHFRLMTLFTDSGGSDIAIHTDNAGVSGLGDSGTLYHLVGASDLNIHVPDMSAAGQVFNLVTDQLFVGQGLSPDSHIKQHSHLTIAADGTLIVEHDLFESVCGS